VSASVKEFWDAQAKIDGAKATAPDTAYRDLEIRSIIPHLRGPKVLDVGCGNGFSTVQFVKAAPETWFFEAVDYSQEMIDRANEVEADNLTYTVGDVLTLSRNFGVEFDCIISERCLINLASWEEQMLALRQMAECLKPAGRMIIVENFTDGLKNLNNVRALFDLPEIKQRWHNKYIFKPQFEEFCKEHFHILHKENIGNHYYLISRVVYAALAKTEGKEPEYSHPINQIAAKLPTLGGYDYSPNMLYVLEKE
jgi:ubiquinone/menaquinone biosynthesis C-methylase UbiE